MIGKDRVNKRLAYIEQKGETVIHLYDLWKALDFEKMIKILAEND